MSRVRINTVKRASRAIIERYYPRLGDDFATNARVVQEIAVFPTKRMRNKIAGFTTHLMKRIAKGPVRGISFKLQEEERERKDQYVPDVSALAPAKIEIDSDTAALIAQLGFSKIPNVEVSGPVLAQQANVGRRYVPGAGPAKRN